MDHSNRIYIFLNGKNFYHEVQLELLSFINVGHVDFLLYFVVE